MARTRASASFSHSDLGRCQAVIASLLSPASQPGLDTWAEKLLRLIAELFDCAGAFLMVPPGVLDEGLHVIGPALDPECLRALQAVASGGADPLAGDPEHGRAMRRLAAAQVQVFDPPTVERLTRVPLRSMRRFYPEVMVDCDVRYFATAAIWLGEGPVLLSCLSDAPGGGRFGDGALDVLSLLVPALESGVCSLRSFRERRTAFSALLDEMEAPALLRSTGGEYHRNRSLRTMLQIAADPESLLEAMDRLAAEVLRLYQPARKSVAEPRLDTGTRTIDADGHRLHLHGTCLPPGSAGPDPTALIIAEDRSACIPDARTLSGRYGLTPRQAQVAQLLARGDSNHDIADRLGISPHTARHHAQRVLEKVGTHSRKAVGLRFLADRRGASI
ncbi:MAG: helix-turn-helix transcriptional regulator [Gemmatimonadota bacterium]